ncbi:uncharacterized protein YjgD (DUF1641 family) [Pullulanibacillus pueri]|uniref:DUF1641 domain-containing protein n=1 Tax=Pullulanibacillus pueri TaxID=1437324 RepID=A0A8J2ZYN6_9BACL|nr:DUF1641 domain-containing protein [Pullulanibacillus pueri]MBM7681018.1 uncharacterized protein YjgD (DUF1641 family) [Pullulanibacillus pueri]GGH86314.1 hypothetical protein GCM10007096_33740 [Pullulanibacillus pueri]
MAEPITHIHKPTFTEEQVMEQKLEVLKKQFANNEDALNKILDIVGELHEIGVLEAANSALQAKEKIAKIVLEQVSREPVTHLLNTLMGATGAMMAANPNQITTLIKSAMAGVDAGSQFVQEDKRVRVRDLMKTLKDPDINRAIGFGLHFLKGMGKELQENDQPQK